MNLNLFRYLTQKIEDPSISRTRDERHCKCMESSSIYRQQKDQKKEAKIDIRQQNATKIDDWITICPQKENFTGLEQIEINEKFQLPYEGKQIFTRWTHSYPNSNELKSKTFYIKYEKELLGIDRIMLNNFQNKYLYHVIDDILYSLKSQSVRQNNLLSIIYSPVLYLQNNFSIDFFDIWVGDIYINQESKVNKFLAKRNSNFGQLSYITIKLFYTTKLPIKKLEPLW